MLQKKGFATLFLMLKDQLFVCWIFEPPDVILSVSSVSFKKLESPNVYFFFTPEVNHITIQREFL